MASLRPSALSNVNYLIKQTLSLPCNTSLCEDHVLGGEAVTQLCQHGAALHAGGAWIEKVRAWSEKVILRVNIF